MKGPWRLRSVPLVSVSLFPAPSRFCGCVHMHQVCPPSPLQCKSREVAQEAIERGGSCMPCTELSDPAPSSSQVREIYSTAICGIRLQVRFRIRIDQGLRARVADRETARAHEAAVGSARAWGVATRELSRAFPDAGLLALDSSRVVVYSNDRIPLFDGAVLSCLAPLVPSPFPFPLGLILGG